MNGLLSPAIMPAIHGVRMPREFYWVLQEPAPLAGMAYPWPGTPWTEIAAAGFKHVVCLASEAPGYDPAPMERLYTTELEDLVHTRPPRDPAREERLIRDAVGLLEGQLMAGQGVVVHCAGGTGRTGTVIGCALRSLGFPTRQVLDYLYALNVERGNTGWPEASWQARLVETFLIP